MSRVEVFADIWCPFAHVGLRAFRALRDERGHGDEPLWVRAWPLELVNGRPQDPAKAAEHVRDLQEQVDPNLFGGFDPEHFPVTSLPALALAARAYRVDGRTGEAVSFALRDALWDEGLDIGDAEVVGRIAAEYGCRPAADDDHASIHADWEEGQRRGVRGSPHFLRGDQGTFCPYLDPERDADGNLHVHRNVAALEAFADICWPP